MLLIWELTSEGLLLFAPCGLQHCADCMLMLWRLLADTMLWHDCNSRKAAMEDVLAGMDPILTVEYTYSLSPFHR